jgi:subtilisin family serine protease
MEWTTMAMDTSTTCMAGTSPISDSSIYDNASDDSHGTTVAGTIGGTGGNAQGVAGVSWDVSMISLRIFYPFRCRKRSKPTIISAPT